MNHREFVRKEFVYKKAIQCLAIGPDDMVLHIGVDQNIFYELVRPLVRECHGVEREQRKAKRASRRFRGAPNILIQHGLLTNLPYPKAFFNKIVVHELSTLVSSELELRRVLDEVKRVASADAKIFIGGISMFREPLRGIKAKLGWSLGQWLGVQRQKWAITAPIVAGIHAFLREWTGTSEPGFMLSEEHFLTLCEEYGLKGYATRFELTHALSLSQTDVVLRHDAEQKTGMQSPSDVARYHPPGERT